MDEAVFYVTQGRDDDKQSHESLGAVSSIHTSLHYSSFRNADCPPHGAALTGMGPGEHLFVAGRRSALITSYAWGKESADQRFPIPEPMACLAVAPHPKTTKHTQGSSTSISTGANSGSGSGWLLAAGSKTGKLYVWEIASGRLVCVKDAHYQAVSVVRFSRCGTYVVSGGHDSRVMVWRVADLVGPDMSTAKPVAAFADHLLAVTDVAVPETNTRIYSASLDGTVRLYDIGTKTPVSTYVFSAPVHALAVDPAARAFYAALGDGSVRQVGHYSVNKYSHVLEAVGGAGKIITVEADPELASTFVHHQEDASGEAAVVTLMAVSMDGMCIVSGDSRGRVFVADVVTKQVVKAFTPCTSGIALVQLGVHGSTTLSATGLDKKHRLLAPLKRVVASEDVLDHSVSVLIAPDAASQTDFAAWLQEKAGEELSFKRESAPAQKLSNSKDAEDLELKLQKVSAAYNSLKTMYEELYAEHNK